MSAKSIQALTVIYGFSITGGSMLLLYTQLPAFCIFINEEISCVMLMLNNQVVFMQWTLNSCEFVDARNFYFCKVSRNNFAPTCIHVDSKVFMQCVRSFINATHSSLRGLSYINLDPTQQILPQINQQLSVHVPTLVVYTAMYI